MEVIFLAVMCVITSILAFVEHFNCIKLEKKLRDRENTTFIGGNYEDDGK